MRPRLAAVPPEYRSGGDPYKAIASTVLQKHIENVTKEERDRAKQAFWAAFTARAPEILTNLIQGDDDDDY